MPLLQFATIASPGGEESLLILVGIVAGLLGGLLGIGGGIVMIPAITLLLGRDIHLAQAASMNVIFFVAAPAAIRHWKAGGMRLELIVRILPFALISVILGVTASIWIPDADLSLIFGLFLPGQFHQPVQIGARNRILSRRLWHLLHALQFAFGLSFGFF